MLSNRIKQVVTIASLIYNNETSFFAPMVINTGAFFILLPYYMTTVYIEIVKYCEKKDKIIPIRTEREKIGIEVSRRWRREGGQLPVTKIKQEEVDGEFYVVEYPDSFSPTIENYVHRYYLSLSSVPPKIKKRKRIPIKSKLVYSSSK